MSGIVITIKAGETFEQSSVTATGQLVDIITDSERASFGIGSDDDLKRSVENYFGQRPNDAFLHSPTPWNDLYKRYGWAEVQRVIEPKKAEILEVATKPTIVTTETLSNESNNTATFSTKISEQVSNSVTSQWSNSSSVAVGQSINYGISFFGAGVSGQTTFGFTQNWGKSESVTRQTTLGTETAVSVELKPKESAIVELSASSGMMHVQITYEAYLRGCTAINYNPTYKDHHFWCLGIGDALGRSNKVQIIEDVYVGYYSNSTATVKNGKTMARMAFHMVDRPNEPTPK